MNCKLTPFTWNWPAITAGDTMPGILIAGTDTPDGIDLVRVRMQVKDIAGTTVVDFDSDDTGIAITDAAQWEFEIDSFIAPTSAGVYKYDIETTDSNDDIATIVRGSWQVEPQTTV
jgi:hypothetical protein